MKLRLFAAVSIVALSLAACQSDQPGTPQAAPVVSGEPSLSSDLTIGDHGVAGITRDTAFSMRALQQAMPGYKIGPVQLATEHGNPHALALYLNDREMLQVVDGGGGRIAAVFGVSPHLAGPNGERIGMSLVESGVEAGACHIGSGNWRGMPICRARGTSHISLVFSIPGYESSGALPPPEMLRRAELQRIIWQPG